MEKEKKTATNKDGRQGFSLIELLVAMTVVIIILGFVAALIAGIQREFNTQRPRVEAVNNVQIAMDEIIRIVRMAGTKSSACAGSYSIVPLTPSGALGGGTYGSLQVQADWNAPNCNLNGVDENVTFSAAGGNFYLDAAQTIALTDRVGALRFKFYNSSNTLILDPVTGANQITFVNIEIDTADAVAPRTITSGVQVRGR